jgi:hypothetical protein
VLGCSSEFVKNWEAREGNKKDLPKSYEKNKEITELWKSDRLRVS